MQSTGKCLCGSVGFTMQFPSKWIAHCHCTMCQRAHGAAFVTWVSVDQSQVVLHDADNKLHWFASSPEAERGFCLHCGSTLFFRSSKWPGEFHIVRANFIEPLDREPQVHAFFDTHVSWFSVNDTLPQKPAPTISN